MTKLPAVTQRQQDEVHKAIDRTNTFADALDQVFRKVVVAECLLMAALSHYDATSGVPSDKLQEFTRAITNDLLSAKRLLMALKVAAKPKPGQVR